MTDEPSFKTKTDVLDLIISFLMEHEKQMDQMLHRVERMAETLARRDLYTEQAPVRNNPAVLQPHAFTLTINNPESFRELKSLRIEWGSKHGDAADVDIDAGMTIIRSKVPSENT